MEEEVAMYSCNQCSKTFTRSDNLKRHEKFHCTDKMIRHGGGLMFTPASNGVVAARKIDTAYKHVDDDAVSSSSSDETSIADASDDDNASMVSTIADEDDASDNDDEVRVDEDTYFWYHVYRISKVKDEKHFIEAFVGLLVRYMVSKEDDLYQKIMKDVSKFKDDGLEFEEAIADTILKHKKAITLKCNSCKPSTEDEDDLDLWCDFINEDAEPWCTFFTGEKCSCNDCGNMSLSKLVAFQVYILHLMDNDCLVQAILAKLPEGEGVLVPVVNQYRKLILEKYASVKDLLSRCNGRPKCPKPMLLLWKYINDSE